MEDYRQPYIPKMVNEADVILKSHMVKEKCTNCGLCGKPEHIKRIYCILMD
jgi:hypothetical protein